MQFIISLIALGTFFTFTMASPLIGSPPRPPVSHATATYERGSHSIYHPTGTHSFTHDTSTYEVHHPTPTHSFALPTGTYKHKPFATPLVNDREVHAFTPSTTAYHHKPFGTSLVNDREAAAV
jgi:hypothetical protein